MALTGWLPGFQPGRIKMAPKLNADGRQIRFVQQDEMDSMTNALMERRAYFMLQDWALSCVERHVYLYDALASVESPSTTAFSEFFNEAHSLFRKVGPCPKRLDNIQAIASNFLEVARKEKYSFSQWFRAMTSAAVASAVVPPTGNWSDRARMNDVAFKCAFIAAKAASYAQKPKRARWAEIPFDTAAHEAEIAWQHARLKEAMPGIDDRPFKVTRW